MLKRIVSGSLAFCLASLLLLSAPLEARAAADELLATASNAKPVVIDREPIIALEDPEDDALDLTDIIGAGANYIDDFDPDSLEPLSPEAVEFIENYQANDDLDVSKEHDDSNLIATQSLTAAAAAAAAILFAAGASALITNIPAYTYQRIIDCMEDGWSVNWNFLRNGVVKTCTITALTMQHLKNALDSASTEDGVSISLTEDDKIAFAYAVRINSYNMLTGLNPKNVNVKAVDGYKYYYIYESSENYVNTPSCHVLYTPSKVAFAKIASGSSSYFEFYRANAALAEFGYEVMSVYDASYTLSSATGLYEFDQGSVVASNGFKKSSSTTHVAAAFPFLVVSNSKYTSFKDYWLNNSPLLLEVSYRGKIVSTDSIMNLGTVTLKGDVSDYFASTKNYYGTTSALNSAAGTVTGTKTDTDTKPGTDTGTGSGSTTGTTTVDMSGVITELQTLRGIITTMQTNVGTMSTTMTSVVAELQEIKAALKDVSAGVTTKVDFSPVVDVLEDVQADILDIQDTIEVLRADVAYQQELITDIKTNVASIPALIDDVRADVKAIPAVIDDVRADVKVLTDSLLDVYPALDSMTGTITDTGTMVGSKVDALPGAITDTMTGAIVTDLTQAQTSKDWGMTSPLYNRFPFSIPWDVAGCFSLLVADPVKPIWKIPFKIDNPAIKVDQEIVIDLSGDDWQGPVKVVRAFILIAFIAALAVITRALIKG